MNALFASVSENVQFVLLCLAVTAAVVLLAWGGEKLVMKKRHQLNAAHTITTIAMLAAISGVLMVIEIAREPACTHVRDTDRGIEMLEDAE